MGTGGAEFEPWLPLPLPVSSELVLVSLQVKLISLYHALSVDARAGSHGTWVTNHQATPRPLAGTLADCLLLVPTPVFCILVALGPLRAVEHAGLGTAFGTFYGFSSIWNLPPDGKNHPPP